MRIIAKKKTHTKLNKNRFETKSQILVIFRYTLRNKMYLHKNINNIVNYILFLYKFSVKLTAQQMVTNLLSCFLCRFLFLFHFIF